MAKAKNLRYLINHGLKAVAISKRTIVGFWSDFILSVVVFSILIDYVNYILVMENIILPSRGVPTKSGRGV